MTEQNKSLLEMLFKLNKMMMRYQFVKFSNHGPHGNPERGQGRVLSILKIKPEITQKELAFILDMRNQSLGELLTKLEKKGFITREQSKEDKRVMIVKITEEGKTAASSVEDIGEEIDKLFSVLTDEEQENLKIYLKKIIDEIAKKTPEFDKEDFHKMQKKMHGKFRRGDHGMSHGGGRFQGGHPFMNDTKEDTKDKD